MTVPAFDAVVLAGGGGSRAGGVDKPGLVVGERTLVASVVSAAVSAGALRLVVVGPRRPELLTGGPQPPLGLAFTREDPPGTGPVAALIRGLADVSAPVVAALAADLPFLRARHLTALLAEVCDGAAGAVMLDASGHPQWLLGCWRTVVVRQALASYTGRSLRGALGPLEPVMVGCAPVPGEPPPWLDCDTPADLLRARRYQHEGAGSERA